MNLSKNTKLILVKAGQATGTTQLGTSVIDMAGFNGVLIFGSLATANVGNFAKAREGDASDMSDGADLQDTKNTPANNGDSFEIDIYKPKKRYIDVQIIRGVTTITGDVYALLYDAPRKSPTSQGSTINLETFASPAEGTA